MPFTVPDERSRLAALRRYGILDTPAEQAFDDLVVAAAFICGTPMALVSLVDSERQWHKAAYGVETTDLPRQRSFCSHAIAATGLFEVEDLSRDDRFADNPMVEDPSGPRFYAGAPLVTSDGFGLGTLCVLDDKPRTLLDPQRAGLMALSRVAVALLEARRLTRSLLSVSDTLERLGSLSAATDLATATSQVTTLVAEIVSSDGAVLLLPDPNDPGVLVAHGATAETADAVAQIGQLRIDVTRPGSATAAAARLGEPVFVGDVERSTVIDINLARRFGARSALFLPLSGGAGVLVAWWRHPHGGLDEATRRLTALLAAQAGPSLQRLLALQRLQVEAATDALTGLPNRRALRAALSAATPGCAVVIADLDHFKHVNDQFGHDAGDQVLRAFAQVLRATTRAGDTAGRWGGEEFLLVVQEGRHIADKLLERLRQVWADAPGRAGVTFSAGIAVVLDGGDGTEALTRADQALYAAKAAGRDTTRRGADLTNPAHQC